MFKIATTGQSTYGVSSGGGAVTLKLFLMNASMSCRAISLMSFGVIVPQEEKYECVNFILIQNMRNDLNLLSLENGHMHVTHREMKRLLKPFALHHTLLKSMMPSVPMWNFSKTYSTVQRKHLVQ